MTRRGIAIGDLHSGSAYAPLPPSFETYDGSLKPWNPAQEYLYKCWDDFTWRAHQFDPEYIIVNGDCVEGPQRKSEGYEVALPSMEDQVRACVGVLSLLKQRCPVAKWFFTQGCFVPGNRVLKQDLSWTPVEKLEVGDMLLAFDEHKPAVGSVRRWKQSEVTAKSVYPKAVSEVQLSDGSTFTVTDDHPWLVLPWQTSEHYQWRRTCELIPGVTRIRRLVKPWEQAKDYETGWLAGIFDGEGTYHKHCGIASFTQNPGYVLGRACQHINRLGFSFYAGNKRVNDETKVISIEGGISENIRFLGTVRPERIVNRAKELRQGVTFAPETLTVTSVKSRGQEDIVGISTSSGTYITEGFGAHNTPYHVGHWNGAEEAIAKQMGGEAYPSVGVGGKHCREVLWLNLDGVIIEATHHPSGSSTGFYRMTTLDRDAQWSAMAAKDPSKGIPKADLLVRSHLHFFGIIEHASKQVLQLPCWKLGDRHSRKGGLHRFLPDIGGAFIESDGKAKERGNAPCQVRKELYSLPPVKIFSL